MFFLCFIKSVLIIAYGDGLTVPVCAQICIIPHYFNMYFAYPRGPQQIPNSPPNSWK